MQKFSALLLLRTAAAAAGFFLLSAWATAGTQYVVTNDDAAFPFPTGVSFYTVGANGLLVFQQQVQTGQFGIGGGYFGMSRVVALDTAQQQCVYASEGANRDVVGINVSTLTVGGSASGSETDGGTSNGIGLAMNSNYLYASFSDSNTIGTFAVESGCGLTFIGDTSAKGSHGGIINGMAVHGTMLIASFTDGSIASFNISGGTPLPNGDEQTATAMMTLAGRNLSQLHRHYQRRPLRHFWRYFHRVQCGDFRHFFRQARKNEGLSIPDEHQFQRSPFEPR